jgi:uncharacterized phage-associated protein
MEHASEEIKNCKIPIGAKIILIEKQIAGQRKKEMNNKKVNKLLYYLVIIVVADLVL